MPLIFSPIISSSNLIFLEIAYRVVISSWCMVHDPCKEQPSVQIKCTNREKICAFDKHFSKKKYVKCCQLFQLLVYLIGNNLGCDATFSMKISASTLLRAATPLNTNTEKRKLKDFGQYSFKANTKECH